MFMKKMLAIASLALASSVWASPACYIAEESWYEIPQEICFEEILANVDTEELRITETTKIFPTTLASNYFARRNENGFSFRTSHTHIDNWSGGCEDGLTIVINVRGQTDNDGYVEVTHLEVSADYEHAFDSCHSRIRKGTVRYKLKN
jgi:hypothetical protein